ncbi:MAG TPA: DUF433 domain-containing protein, partial [Solirubrobacterales bacterium]|nr:DUF433 domain-containing protein [Solirubrobacterales bacterium]
GTLAMAQKRIAVDPNRMRGLPCIRDTRLTVNAVLGRLVAGASIDKLLADYPYLEREDILAALEYAAPAAQEHELAFSELSDLGARAHRIAESPEGELIDDEASIRRLLGL